MQIFLAKPEIYEAGGRYLYPAYDAANAALAKKVIKFVLYDFR